MDKIEDLIIKYKGVILYLVFGVLTTLINIVTFWLLDEFTIIPVVWSTFFAWVIAVVFAYVTNKIWVFESKGTDKKELLSEFTSFMSCRGITGALDMFIMWLFAVQLHFNNMVVKIASNVLVVILNYVASKIIVFKKKDEEEKGGEGTRTEE